MCRLNGAQTIIILLLKEIKMQNNISTIDKTKFMPFSVGFDDLFDRLFEMDLNSSSYPPYNIVKNSDYNYTIEMALAGFNKSQIQIEHADSKLNIRSQLDEKTNQNSSNLIHQGISQRSFQRSFTLSDEIHVKSAELKDGMLRIKLEKIIPDHKKPKLIKIN